MRYIIVDNSCTDLRRIGRKHLAGKWKQSAIAVALFLVLLELPLFPFLYLFGPGSANLYTLLVAGPLALGLAAYYLKLFRDEPTKPTDLFHGFEYFSKALGLYVLITIFIFLWALLFIIPGIIAACRYSQAFFILADDPSKGVMQCISESKERMHGNKGKFFVLGLSFIGWSLLAMVPVSIISGIISGGILSMNDAAINYGASSPYEDIMMISYIGNSALLIVNMVTFVLVLVPIAFLGTYVYSTFAGFYEILAGNYNPNAVNGYASVEKETPYAQTDSGIGNVDTASNSEKDIKYASKADADDSANVYEDVLANDGSETAESVDGESDDE